MDAKWAQCDSVMASLTLKNVSEKIVKQLRKRAHKERRSVNQEALYLIEQALGLRPAIDEQLSAWRDLAGRRESTQSAAEESAEIYGARTPGRSSDL